MAVEELVEECRRRLQLLLEEAVVLERVEGETAQEVCRRGGAVDVEGNLDVRRFGERRRDGSDEGTIGEAKRVSEETQWERRR